MHACQEQRITKWVVSLVFFLSTFTACPKSRMTVHPTLCMSKGEYATERRADELVIAGIIEDLSKSPSPLPPPPDPFSLVGKLQKKLNKTILGGKGLQALLGIEKRFTTPPEQPSPGSKL